MRRFKRLRCRADPTRVAAEIDEEFAFHLHAAERDARAAGLPEDQARERARVAFGDVSSHRDACLRVTCWSDLMMKKMANAFTVPVMLAVVFVLGTLTPDAIDKLTETQWKRVGAFEGVVWRGDQPVVLVENRWYMLDAVNGRTIDGFLEATHDHFGDRTQKRFKEDFYEVLVALGERPDAIDATLRDPVSGEVIEKLGIELDKEKRRRAYRGRWQESADVPRPPAGSRASAGCGAAASTSPGSG